MIFEAQSGGKTYEFDAPSKDAFLKTLHDLFPDVKPPGGAMGALAGPAQAAAGAAAAGAPSVASDITDSAASRYQAGLLDIPGIPGDVVGMVKGAAGWTADKIKGAFGETPEEQAARHKLIERQPANPLDLSGYLPTSEGIKKAVGFEAYQPQTEAGKTFDRYGGAGIEMAPSVLMGGAAGGVKKVIGDTAKYAMAPAAAGEIAGDVTKGTPLEPVARLGAMLATGGLAGAKGAKVTGALSAEEWGRVGSQAYKDMKAAGVGVKPASFDRAVNDIEQQLHVAGYRPALHGPVEKVLNELKASKGVPQSFEELDQLHRLAMGQTKNIDADTRRVAGMLADKIDNFMENLKPADLMAGDPKTAFNALVKGRDAWRKMRNGERINNMIEKAKDAAGANYTAAGYQTALKQQFRAFKWKGKAEITPDYKRLSSEEKMLVDAIIRGGNALRLMGKFNFRNPVVAALMGSLAVTGSPVLAAGALGAAEAARRLSARGTLNKVNQLDNVIRGGKVTPGSWGRPPNAVFYGPAAGRASDQSK